jgi:lipopolysaccharide transport system ATP-binding protein
MHVRLAFAVAAHLEPEVLIIDEVLAVGDAQFQKRCLGKMGEVASGGRTVLFVSHNMTAVRTLCQRTILLDRGRVQLDGDTAESVTEYYRNQQESQKEAFWDRIDDAPGDEVLRIRFVRVRALESVSDGSITMEDEIQISTEYWVLKPGETCHITYHLINHEGVTVLTTANKPSTYEIDQYRSSFVIPPNLLNSGTYFLKLLIVRNENSVSRVFDSIASFEILDTGQRETACVGREPGVVCPKLVWTNT